MMLLRGRGGEGVRLPSCCSSGPLPVQCSHPPSEQEKQSRPRHRAGQVPHLHRAAQRLLQRARRVAGRSAAQPKVHLGGAPAAGGGRGGAGGQGQLCQCGRHCRRASGGASAGAAGASKPGRAPTCSPATQGTLPPNLLHPPAQLPASLRRRPLPPRPALRCAALRTRRAWSSRTPAAPSGRRSGQCAPAPGGACARCHSRRQHRHSQQARAR